MLHAWGDKQQPGLYSLIRNAHGLSALVEDPPQPHLSPSQRFARACQRLLQTTGGNLQPLFDAILIDEGQNLVFEDEFKVEDKQPFYWMAYQFLRPLDPDQPEARCLIWAYDEAQSLDSLIIPQAKALFGDRFSDIVSGQYLGGIRKSEIMPRCYRIPGPILTAAHAIGMGLLRPEGILSGLTQAKDWQAIGYDVEGSFRSGQTIVLKRQRQNSPNPVPQLWPEPVLQFHTYSDRASELQALAQQIQCNLSQDGLKPSRQILVIVLGTAQAAIALEQQVAYALQSQRINTYIPSALKFNRIPEAESKNPDQFWWEGAVTVSRIHRAKGNEADMVYVVGFDQVAQDESSIPLRNQLFVALTRARGWAVLSGIGGESPLYEEMQQVIASGDTFTFSFKRPPQRDMAEAAEQPDLTAGSVD